MLKIRLIPNKVMLNIYLRPFRNFSSTQKENSDIYLGSTSPGAIVPVSVVRVLVQKNATDGTSSLQPNHPLDLAFLFAGNKTPYCRMARRLKRHRTDQRHLIATDARPVEDPTQMDKI